jgi:hypothetical protein
LLPQAWNGLWSMRANGNLMPGFQVRVERSKLNSMVWVRERTIRSIPTYNSFEQIRLKS